MLQIPPGTTEEDPMTGTNFAGGFARNARMILRLLAKPDARLVESGSNGWRIETGNGRRLASQPVDGAMARGLVDKDWLIREPTGSYGISAAGERLLAEAGGSGEDRCGGQHRLMRRPERGDRRAVAGPAVNEAESPLGWLRSRRDKQGVPLISEAQYDAGERLRVDFTVARMAPRVTSSWDACVASGSHGRAGRGPGSLEISERALAAKQRFLQALDAVGPELSGILVDVCCLSRGLEAAERGLGWPQRSGKLVLQIALTQLARHYGLIRAPADATRPARVRQWGVTDYRPHAGFIAGDEDQP
jgi:hypothetical protein